MRVKANLPRHLNASHPVKTRLKKILLFRTAKSTLYLPPSRSFQKGRLAIVTNAERDAVDVDAPLTNGAKADGEIVWS
jgi:hypothetical protein